MSSMIDLSNATWMELADEVKRLNAALLAEKARADKAEELLSAKRAIAGADFQDTLAGWIQRAEAAEERARRAEDQFCVKHNRVGWTGSCATCGLEVAIAQVASLEQREVEYLDVTHRLEEKLAVAGEAANSNNRVAIARANEIEVMRGKLAVAERALEKIKREVICSGDHSEGCSPCAAEDALSLLHSPSPVADPANEKEKL